VNALKITDGKRSVHEWKGKYKKEPACLRRALVLKNSNSYALSPEQPDDKGEQLRMYAPFTCSLYENLCENQGNFPKTNISTPSVSMGVFGSQCRSCLRCHSSSSSYPRDGRLITILSEMRMMRSPWNMSGNEAL